MASGPRQPHRCIHTPERWRWWRSNLPPACVGMSIARRSLAELLELPPDRALLAILDGPDAGLGLMMLSPAVLSALIEVQTIGRVSAQPPAARKPTRTDAAMVAGVIDRALGELDTVLAEEADLIWAGGFRYASFLEDARPLGRAVVDRLVAVGLHENTGHVLEPRGLRVGGVRVVDGDADHGAAHLAVRNEVVHHLLGQRDGDREAVAGVEAGAAGDRAVDADHLAADVDERPARVAGVDRGVGLM